MGNGNANIEDYGKQQLYVHLRLKYNIIGRPFENSIQLPLTSAERRKRARVHRGALVQVTPGRSTHTERWSAGASMCMVRLTFCRLPALHPVDLRWHQWPQPDVRLCSVPPHGPSLRRRSQAP